MKMQAQSLIWDIWAQEWKAANGRPGQSIAQAVQVALFEARIMPPAELVNLSAFNQSCEAQSKLAGSHYFGQFPESVKAKGSSLCPASVALIADAVKARDEAAKKAAPLEPPPQ